MFTSKTGLRGAVCGALFAFLVAAVPAMALDTTNVAFVQTVSVRNVAHRSDYLNLTMGGHFAFGFTALRFGFVQPLRTGDDRLFNNEFNVQVNRIF